MFILVKPIQPEKADSPILVMLSGIVMLAKLRQLKNVRSVIAAA